MSKVHHNTTQTSVVGKGFLIQCIASDVPDGIIVDLQTEPRGADGYALARRHAYATISPADALHLIELLRRAIDFSEAAVADQPQLSLVA